MEDNENRLNLLIAFLLTILIGFIYSTIKIMIACCVCIDPTASRTSRLIFVDSLTRKIKHDLGEFKMAKI